jgi:hypothetical protein
MDQERLDRVEQLASRTQQKYETQQKVFLERQVQQDARLQGIENRLTGVCAQQKDTHTELHALEPKLRAAIADAVNKFEQARAAQETAWGTVHQGFEQKLAEVAKQHVDWARAWEASPDRAWHGEDRITLDRLSALQAQVADQIADLSALHHQLGLKVDMQGGQLADSLRQTTDLHRQLAEHSEIIFKPAPPGSPVSHSQGRHRLEYLEGEVQALSGTVGTREKEPSRGSHSHQLERLWTELGERSGRAEVERMGKDLQRLGAAVGEFLKETDRFNRPTTVSGLRRTGGGFTTTEPVPFSCGGGIPSSPKREYSYDTTQARPLRRTQTSGGEL